MRILTLVAAALIFKGCIERKTVELKRKDSVSITPIPEVTTETHASPVTIWASDGVEIYADTTLCRPTIHSVRKKFEPYITFEDFPVKRDFDRPKANLILDKDAKRFRTMIADAFEEDTEHFAGHYIFVYWGCGSPCHDGVLIDRNTGRIYHIPDAAAGYDFRDNSRLLITNLPDTSGFYTENYFYSPAIYVFNESTKEFEERKPR